MSQAGGGRTLQQNLFDAATLEELEAEASVELVQALEALTAPDGGLRAKGLKQLLELDAHRRSPLAGFFLTQRLLEPDVKLREKIVAALDESLHGMDEPIRPPERVLEWMRYGLSEMRQPQVYALLSLVINSPDRFDAICRLLNACSFAGEALIGILGDRRVEVAVRSLAAQALGVVGFLEAIPALESMSRRLSGRRQDQLAMRFAPRPDPEAELLLPAVQRALSELESRG